MLPYCGCGAYLFALPLTGEGSTGRCAFFPPGLWLIRIFKLVNLVALIKKLSHDLIVPFSADIGIHAGEARP